MQMMINIDEATYNDIKKGKVYSSIRDVPQEAVSAIKNGTPLPREHGELVDRDAINERFNAIWDELEVLSNQPTYKELLDKFTMCLDTAKTIIEDNYEEAEEELWK